MTQQSEFDRTMQTAFDAGMSDMKVFVPLFFRPSVTELQSDILAFEKAIAEGRVRPVAAVD
jgi:hypothetical protein